MLRVYKVISKTVWGPWLRGDCLGPAGAHTALHSLHVLLSEFVSWSAGSQHSHCQSPLSETR